jgi:hypothetical protein
MMKRRTFLQTIAWITGGLLLKSCVPARDLFDKGEKIKGRVTSNGKPLPDVVISDGYTVVATNTDGAFELVPNGDAVALFVSTPAGYEFLQSQSIARHYYLLTDISNRKDVNFELQPLGADDSDHSFIVWADPQVKNASDVSKMMSHPVKDVQQLVREQPGTLLHGICVGDIVWDAHEHFADYDKAVAAMGIPFYQCLGNHDMDYEKGGDSSSDDTFQRLYGPTYYSFNRGKVHYVVMDNVRYLGKDRDYDGFFQQHQLDWLQKDLSFVEAENLLVLCVHIPVHHTKNKAALYQLLVGRKTHIISGHTHYHQNNVLDNIFEHNLGTVCGAWWTGPVCVDGAPNGYGVFQAKGAELSWYYKGTGKDPEHQMSVTSSPISDTEKQVVVNIWNYDPAWKNEFWLDGVSQGPLEQFDGYDPFAYSLLSGPEKPKPRGFAEPHKTDHLFRAVVPASARQVKVKATDRFGKVYETVHQLV